MYGRLLHSYVHVAIKIFNSPNISYKVHTRLTGYVRLGSTILWYKRTPMKQYPISSAFNINWFKFITFYIVHSLKLCCDVIAHCNCVCNGASELTHYYIIVVCTNWKGYSQQFPSCASHALCILSHCHVLDNNLF